MKIILISVIAIVFYVKFSYAQDSVKSEALIRKTTIVGREQIDLLPEEKQKMIENKEKRNNKIQNLPFEKKERVKKRREKFKSLSLEKQKAIKIEMKRHREEMKKITGEI